MRSVLIIGIGRFGRHLASKFVELGTEVMIVDQEEKNIGDLVSVVTSAQVADCTDERVIESLEVDSFDICFVCISTNFQSSLEITSQLKEHGAKHVVSRASRDIQAKFLLRNGADAVIYPERDVAYQAAVKYSDNNVFEYMELTPDYAICEISPPQKWLGRTLREIGVRSNHNINIIAYRRGEQVMPLVQADYVCKPEEHLVVAGALADTEKLLRRR